MRLAGISGLVLLLAMFLPWFGADQLVALPDGSQIIAEGGNANAWESFALLDLLLFGCGGLALVFALAAASAPPPRNPAIPPGLAVTVAGALAVVVIFFRLIDPPSLADDVVGAVDTGTGRRIGILVGLIASCGIAFGGYVATGGQGSRVEG